MAIEKVTILLVAHIIYSSISPGTGWQGTTERIGSLEDRMSCTEFAVDEISGFLRKQTQQSESLIDRNNKDMQDEISKMRSDASGMTSTVSALVTENEDRKDEISTVEVENAQLKENVSHLLDEHLRMNTSILDQEMEFGRMKVNISELATKNKRLVENLTILVRDNIQIRNTTEEMKVENRQRDVEVAALSEQSSNMRNNITLLDQDKERMKSNITSLVRHINNLTRYYVVLENRLAVGAANSTRIRTNITILERENTQMVADITSLAEKTDELEHSILALMDSDIAMGSNITTLIDENTQMRENISSLEAENVQIKGNVTTANEQNARLESSLDSLMGEIREMRENLTNMAGEIDTLTEMNKLQERNTSVLAQRIVDLEGRLLLSNSVPGDCEGLYRLGQRADGSYTSRLENGQQVTLSCDMTSEGAPWTVIQQRHTGTPSFYRAYVDYQRGFGAFTTSTDFWLGLDILHQLTKRGDFMLRVELEDWDAQTTYANYNHFTLAGESDGYRLHLTGYDGTAGDAMLENNGQQFSTYDRDQDQLSASGGRGDGGDSSNGNCAEQHSGAWWYNSCGGANLNGNYQADSTCTESKCVFWSTWKGVAYSLKKTTMKIKRSPIPN